VFSTLETVKLDLTLCFKKYQFSLLTHKDMTFTVHPNEKKHASIERKTTVELMR
jgi:hypothetical protein